VQECGSVVPLWRMIIEMEIIKLAVIIWGQGAALAATLYLKAYALW
jgi:hypothetical protein